MFKISFNLITEKLKENLIKVNKNQKVILDLCKQQEVLNYKQLQKKYSINQMLLSENLDLLNIQLNLVGYLEGTGKMKKQKDKQHSGSFFKNLNKSFDLSLDGFLIYNSGNPSVPDNQFVENLCRYCQDFDNYNKPGKALKTN